MLWEGYKFANGELRRLTQPQIMFLDNFARWKAKVKSGKPPKEYQSAKGMTTEQLHKTMWPVVQKQRQDGLNAEIAAADAVRARWDQLHSNPNAGLKKSNRR